MTHQIPLPKADGDVARIIGNGSMRAGVREALDVYHQLWALGYRPSIPLKWWMRQWAKKKAPPKGRKKESAMAAQYNPKQHGEGSVNQG